MSSAREFGVDDRRMARLGDQLGQAMIILWTDDEVDGGLAAQNFAPLGLGDAAGDDERGVSPSRRSRALEGADLAELGIDLFRGAFADVAGIEDDEVGVLDFFRLGKTFSSRDIGHALRVVDVHLASERLDEHATRVGGGGGGLGQKLGLLGDLLPLVPRFLAREKDTGLVAGRPHPELVEGEAAFRIRRRRKRPPLLSTGSAAAGEAPETQ